MSKNKKDWIDIKLEQVYKKYNLNPKEGIMSLLIKASQVIPSSLK